MDVAAASADDVAYAAEAEAVISSAAKLSPWSCIDEKASELASAGSSGNPVSQDSDDEQVDNSEEVAGTLRAAGRTAERTEDDEDEFSLGSDTADTDIGHGVKINPDI
jgi:hypothetical protein